MLVVEGLYNSNVNVGRVIIAGRSAPASQIVRTKAAYLYWRKR